MTKPAPRSRPTDAELAILQVLWDRGPSTVREVHEALAHRGSGYTTTLKLCQIMAEKDLVDRDESERSHVYRARIARRSAERNLVRKLIDTAFGGSAVRLVASALADRPASREELAEIRAMLDAAERGRR